MSRLADPTTNQFRCNACGRYFNTEGELSSHSVECRAAKVTTREGERELAEQDAHTHQPNDKDADNPPFQHGTRVQ